MGVVWAMSVTTPVRPLFVDSVVLADVAEGHRVGRCVGDVVSLQRLVSGMGVVSAAVGVSVGVVSCRRWG